MIRVQTIGQSVIETPSGTLMPDASINFSLALYLAFERGRRVDRSELEGLLWPGMQASNARHCLRQAVYKLRQSGVAIETGAGFVRIPPEAAEIDLDRVIQEHDPPAELLDGDFLPGFTPASAALAEWLDIKRDSATSRLREVARAAMTAARTRGRWADVERLAQRCLALDPLNEEATLALAEATALSGAKARAVDILDRYIADLGGHADEIRLPATMLRRRIAERLPVPRYAGSSELVFVGRDSDMEVLLGKLANARGGAGGGALLWGEPGIGKTRLAAELMKVATLQGANVQRMVCQATDPGRPFSLYADIVPSLLEMPGALGCSPESLAALKRLIEPMAEAPERPEAYDAGYLFATVRRALFDIVDAVSSERALVVVVEDVHWLDATSWQILSAMLEWASTRKLLFVMTSRTAHPTSEPVAVPAALYTHHVRPLEPEAGVRLVDAFSRLRQRPADAAFRDWCVSVADGNPLFLAELTARWVETGQREGLPPSLAEVIRQRIERVSPITLRAFQACVLLGKSCTLQRLEAVLEYRQHELIDAMAEMEEHDLVLSHGAMVSSRHDLLSTAALSRLPKLGRQALQRRIGVVLEPELLATNSASLLWDCVTNWDAAGETGKAYQLAMRCAEALLGLGLLRDAMVAAELAERFSRAPSEGAEARRVLAAALYHDGQFSRLEPLLESRKKAGEHAGHCDEELWAVRFLEIGDDSGAVTSRLLNCALDPLATIPHRLRACAMAARTADHAAERELAKRAVETAMVLEPTDYGSECDRLEVEIIYHSTFGDPTRSRAAAETLVERAKSAEDHSTRSRALRYQAMPLLMLGETELALRRVTEGIQLARDRGLTYDSVAASSFLGNVLAANGRLHEARAELEKVLSDPSINDERTLHHWNFVAVTCRVALKLGMSDHIALKRLESLGFGSGIPVRTRIDLLSSVLVLRSMRKETPDHTTAETLRRAFEKIWDLGGGDWAAYGVARYMYDCGLPHDAVRYLQEYVHEHRRERRWLPQYLQDLIG